MFLVYMGGCNRGLEGGGLEGMGDEVSHEVLTDGRMAYRGAGLKF